MAAKPAYSSSPVSVIYAQSWPIPKSNCQRFPAKKNSNSWKNNIFSPWLCKPKQHTTRSQKTASQKYKPTSWASSMLKKNYSEWLQNAVHDDVMRDMANEYKMTLQMFKKLEEQVKEVDEQLNSGRKPHSFRHYFSSRSRCLMRTYTPEIPMTNEAYQPCNNFGFERDQRRSPSQSRTHKNEEKSHSIASKSEHEIWLQSRLEMLKPKDWRIEETVDNDNRTDYDNEIDCERKTFRCQNDDFQDEMDSVYSDSSWSSYCELSDEDTHVGFGYIDPIPENWRERKLRELELEFSDNNESDPFMVRLLQLRRLEIETVEQEKRSRKVEETCESLPLVEFGLKEKNKGKKGNDGKKSISGSMKKQSSKILDGNVEKSSRKIVKKSSVSSSSLRDFEKCFPSKEMKLRKADNVDEQNLTKEANYKDLGSNKKNTANSEKKTKGVKGRRRVQSCKGRPLPNRASYSSSVTYDILELAVSFDPPGKERMKANSRPVTAKSAKSKGLLPGKSMFSQRRYSLTADQGVQSNKSDSTIGKSRSSGAKKCGSKTSKRCSSSKI